MTSSKIFLYFCLSFIGGIFLNSFLPAGALAKAGLAILGILFISIFWKYKKIVVIGFSILFLVLGIWRHQQAELEIMNNELRKFNDLEQKIILIGQVIEEADVRESNIKLTIEVESINDYENSSRSAKGKVLATINRYSEYQYGDKLKISGFLKTPQTFEGFNYKDYLQKDRIYSIMNFPEIELIDSGFGNPIIENLLSFKNKLKESLNKTMSPPQSGLLEALFFGDEENLSKAWKEKFNFTGTRHITAVSGMNITIISALILNFLLFLGFWRKRALIFSIFLIFLYILMIGFPASAVRAGIMGALFLIAQCLGRLSDGSRAIFFAAAVMLFSNPLLLKLDIGFQLSFLAMLGLIYLQPVFLDFFKKIPNFFQLRYSLAVTISAQFFTFPILIYNFGHVSLFSILANILIVPLLPIITILGFIFSFLGIFFQPLGQIFSWPAWLLLTYITKVIDLFSKIPLASLSFQISWIWLVIFYLILGFVTRRLNEKQKLKFLNY